MNFQEYPGTDCSSRCPLTNESRGCPTAQSTPKSHGCPGFQQWKHIRMEPISDPENSNSTAREETDTEDTKDCSFEHRFSHTSFVSNLSSGASIRAEQQLQVHVDSKDKSLIMGILSEHDIATCQSTWLIVSRDNQGRAFTHDFYDSLFKVYPELAVIFNHNTMEDQYHNVASALSNLLLALSDRNKLEHIIRDLQALGRRHVVYGVREDDYTKVKIALFMTLNTWLDKLELAQTKKQEIIGSWTNLYTVLEENMKTRQGSRTYERSTSSNRCSR